MLHLLAMAHEAEVELELEDFHRIGSKVPLLGDLKPFGKFVMNDVDHSKFAYHGYGPYYHYRKHYGTYAAADPAAHAKNNEVDTGRA